MVSNLPIISVVIATKNEEKNIENCIKSILDQDFSKENIEIIVVDNNSQDQVLSIAKKYVKSVV